MGGGGGNAGGFTSSFFSSLIGDGGGGNPGGFTSSFFSTSFLMANGGMGAPVTPLPGVGGGKAEGMVGFITPFSGAPVSLRPERGGGGGAGGNPPGVDGAVSLSSSFFSSAGPSSVFSSSTGPSSSFFLPRPSAPFILAKKPTFGASSSSSTMTVGASVGALSDGASEGSSFRTPSSFTGVEAAPIGGVMSFFSAYAGTFSGAGLSFFVTSGSTIILPPMVDKRGKMIKIHALL